MAKVLIILGLLAFLGLTLSLHQVEGNQAGRRPHFNYRQAEENFELPPVDSDAVKKSAIEWDRYGLPSSDNLRMFNAYVLSYDRRLKGPAWVLEYMTNENAVVAADRSKSFFKEDETLHSYFKSTNADYFRSGYDRGHQASAGDFKHDQTLMDQTFALSNIWPQKAAMNRGGWVRLEHYVRALAANPAVAIVYAVTGPLFEPKMDETTGKRMVRYEVIGPNKVAVPTHFYKVILVKTQEGKLSMESFMMPNSDEANMNITSINKYRKPVDQLQEIERSAGVIFFHKVKRSEVLKPEDLQYNYEDKTITFNNHN